MDPDDDDFTPDLTPEQAAAIKGCELKLIPIGYLDAQAERITELEAERDYARRDQRASEQAATDANRENYQHAQRIASLTAAGDALAKRVVMLQNVIGHHGPAIELAAWEQARSGAR